jgi:hypothetical protein
MKPWGELHDLKWLSGCAVRLQEDVPVPSSTIYLLPYNPLQPLQRWRDHLTYACRVFPEVSRMAKELSYGTSLLGISAQ